MPQLFFPYSANTTFFALIGLGLFLLYARNVLKPGWFELDLAMILAWVPLPDYEVGNLKITMILGWLPLFYWIPRLLFLCTHVPKPVAEARPSPRQLKILTGLAVAYLVFLALISPKPFGRFGARRYHLSDSAMSGYAGADQILQGDIPYPGGVIDRESNNPYGPAFFYLYVPVSYFFPESHPQTAYCTGARILGIVIALAGGGILFHLGRRLGGSKAGWGWALFWLASPYLHNATYWAQASHLVPGALSALAVAATLHSATAGGAALGLLASVSYYPILFLPFLARASGRPWRFAIACGAVVTGCFLPVLLAKDGLHRFISHVTFVQGSLQGKRLWGPWSPWAQYPWLMPVRFVLVGVFGVILLLLFVWSLKRPVSLRAAVGASAAVVAAFQAGNEHAPGRYHLWLFPLLLIFILWPREDEGGDRGHAAPGR
jgi:hypothetical protein